MKKLSIILALFIVLVVGYFVMQKSDETTPPDTTTQTSYKDATYRIEGKDVTLKNGVSEVPSAPGSTTMTVTTYRGYELEKDLNGDDKNDVVFVVTQTSGGTGTFYYALGALKTATGYQGIGSALIGDRISMKDIELRNNAIIVNFAGRGPEEPFSGTPTVAKSLYLQVKDGQLIEVPVYLETPTAGSSISSPVTVKGAARGTWFFEANLPLSLLDASGKEIAQGYAMSLGEWMTTDFVGFQGTVTFTTKPASGSKGTLVVKKDNPSGLPQHDRSASFPIVFK